MARHVGTGPCLNPVSAADLPASRTVKSRADSSFCSISMMWMIANNVRDQIKDARAFRFGVRGEVDHRTAPAGDPGTGKQG